MLRNTSPLRLTHSTPLYSPPSSQLQMVPCSGPSRSSCTEALDTRMSEFTIWPRLASFGETDRGRRDLRPE
ncbi:unnamed protein product [Protopolystoma xenopodis]|uniref:Uncharacterized protein n=1 Tax=Protopolystoma xenopodis TaxID=117903 RepID=A0A3S4ZXE7_9PLAT|nr:unnamed protein product [Protopolystoma xenopodis]